MADIYKPTGGPSPGPTGVWIAQKDVLVRARGAAFSKGDVVAIDPTAANTAIEADSDVTSGSNGTTTSVMASVVTPASTNIRGELFAVFGVCLEDIADEADGLVRIQGHVDEAYVIAASGTVQTGANLVVTTAKNLDAVGADGELVVGFIDAAAADIPDTTPTTRTLTPVTMLPPGWYRKTTGFSVT